MVNNVTIGMCQRNVIYKWTLVKFYYIFSNSLFDFSDGSVFTPRIQFDVKQAKPTRLIELFFWNIKKKIKKIYLNGNVPAIVVRRTPRVLDTVV